MVRSLQIRGAIHLRDARLVLDSIDPDLPSLPMASVGSNGQFAVMRVESGDYVIRVLDLPGDAYMKSALSGNADNLKSSFQVAFADLSSSVGRCENPYFRYLP